MRTTVLILALCGVAAFTSHVTTSHDNQPTVTHQASFGPAKTPAWMTRPCPQEEDSVNCYWDASTRGNGVGHSFRVRRMPGGLTCIFYTEPRFAANHDHCAPEGR